MSSYGLGILITARDMASAQMARVETGFNRLEASSKTMEAAFLSAKATFASGIIMAAGGAIALVPLIIGLNKAAALQAGMAEVSTLVDTATTNMEGLTDEVLKLSAAYGLGAIDQAAALYTTISSGAATAADGTIDVAKAVETLDVANQLAIGGVTDVQTAVDGLTSIMGAYGLESQNAIEIADAMFLAMKAGKTTIGELSKEIGKVAATAAQVGVSYEELLASIAAVTTAGIDTAMATTGISSALSNILDPSSNATAEAEKFGIAWGRTALEAQGWAGFINTLGEAVNGLSPELADAARNVNLTDAQFEAYLNTVNDTGADLIQLFGNIRSVRVMMALTGGTAETFNMVVEQMGDRAGETALAVDKMRLTFKFVSSVIKEQFNVIMTQLGRQVLPLAIGTLRFFSGILSGVNALFEKWPGLAKLITTVLGVFGSLLLAFGTYRIVVGAATMASLWFKTAGLDGIIGSAFPVIRALTILAAAITLLVVAYENNLFGLQDALGPTVERLKVWFTDIKDIVLSAIAFVTGAGISKELAESLYDRGLDDSVILLANIFGFVKSLFIGVWEGVQAAGTIIVNVVTSIINAITWLWIKIVDVFGGILPGLKKVGIDVRGQQESWEAWGKTIGKWVGIALTIWAVIEGITFLVGVVRTVTAVIKGVILVMRVLNLVFAANPIGLIIMAIIALAILVYVYWDEIKAFLIATWEVLKVAGAAVWDWIKKTAATVWDAIKSFIKPVVDFYIAMWNLWKQVFLLVWDLIRLATILVWEGLKLAWEATVNFFIAWFERLVSVGTRIWDAIKDAFSSAMNYLEERFPGVFAFIRAGWEVTKLAFQIGIDLVKGFFTGLWTKVLEIKDKIVTAFNFATDLFKEVWQSAIDFVKGLWDGFLDKIRWATDLIETVRGGIGAVIDVVTRGDTDSRALGGEVTSTGYIPTVLHRGEIITTTQTTRGLAELASRVLSSPRTQELGGGTNNYSVNLGERSVVLEFPAITSLDDIDAYELVDRIFDALMEKQAEAGVQTFRTGEGFTPAYG